MRVCMKLLIIESCTYVYISICVCLLCEHMNCSFPLLSRSSDLSVRDMDKSLQAEYYGKAWYWRRRCTPQRHLLLLLRRERTLWLGWGKISRQCKPCDSVFLVNPKPSYRLCSCFLLGVELDGTGDPRTQTGDTAQCPFSMVACGATARIAPFAGRKGDDTAINHVFLACCFSDV